MNSVILMGRLTADPDIRTVGNGKKVCSFRLAVKRAGSSDKADFIPCTAWEQTAEFIGRYFYKGKMIAIQGELQSRDYRDPDTGKNRTAYEVSVKSAYFTEGKGEETAPRSAENAAPSGFGGDFSGFTDMPKVDSDQGDLPF